MTFNIIKNEKTIIEIAKVALGNLKRKVLFVATIGTSILLILYIYVGIVTKNDRVIVIVMSKIVGTLFLIMTLFLFCIIRYGAKVYCLLMRKYNIKEYIETIEFAEEDIIISNNLKNSVVQRINYNRIKRSVSDSNYLMFITKSGICISIAQKDICSIGKENFESFLKEKMPQVNFKLK